MKTYTIVMTIDEDLDNRLETLRKNFKRQSKADIFRFAIALLDFLDKELTEGGKLEIVKNNRRKEIILPRAIF